MATKTLLQASKPRFQGVRDARKPASREPVESARDELLLQSDAVSICLLLNRRHGHLRVIDFRAGPTVAKRNHVLAAARREGIEKVFTLVERDEVATWTRLGFSREGSIPAFYRRSDAWIMGISVASARPMTSLGSADLDGDDDLECEAPPSEASLLAERTIVRAKKLLRDDAPELPSVRIVEASSADVQKAVVAAERKGTALTAFERFGRDAVRATYACSARGVTLHISAEEQPFFHNSFLELLASPRTESERLAATSALGTLCERQRAAGAASAFAVSPADDAAHAAVFLANGFRRSAALVHHLVTFGERKHAIVWSRRLAEVD